MKSLSIGSGGLYVESGVTGNIVYCGRGGEENTVPAIWQKAYPNLLIPKIHMWVIFNNQFHPMTGVTPPNWPAVIQRSLETSTRTATARPQSVISSRLPRYPGSSGSRGIDRSGRCLDRPMRVSLLRSGKGDSGFSPYPCCSAADIRDRPDARSSVKADSWAFSIALGFATNKIVADDSDYLHA